MKEIINNINNSDMFIRILECGAGMPVSNKIFQYANASKTVYSAESYYSRTAHDYIFGQINERAVSVERLKHIMKQTESKDYNTLFCSTFQVCEELTLSTHGWVGIKYKDLIRYYHISIHKNFTRKKYIKLIGNSGIKLLYDILNNTVSEDTFVDIVLDENLKPLYKETLEYVTNHKKYEQMTVIYPNKIDRLDSITRDTDNLSIYKGSFNPITNAHIEILNLSDKDAYFCISSDTIDKGKIDIESLMNRIQMIQATNNRVIVCNKGLFETNLKFIRLKYKNKITFLLGTDTLTRLLKNYSKKDFKETFENTDFICAVRDNTGFNYKLPNVYIKEINYSFLSSSIIRDGINKDIDMVLEDVPQEIIKYLNFYKNEK